MTLASAVAVALPASTIVLLLLGQGHFRGPTLDASVFAQIAEQMRFGDVPYRDVFDHKPPGIYLVGAALGSLLPGLDAWPRAWAVSVAAALGTIALLARRLGPDSRAGAMLALVAAAPALGAHAFAQGGGYTESLAVLPATAGLLVATRTGSPTARHAFAAGVLIGLAGITSFHLVPAAVGALAGLLVAGGRWRAVAAYGAGGSAVAAAIGVWLLGVGAMGDAVEQLVGYNRSYTIGPTFEQPVLPATVIVVAVMIAPAAAASIVRAVAVIRRRRASPLETGAIVWLLCGVTIVALQRQFFGHYVLPLAAPLAVLAAPFLGGTAALLGADRGRRAAAIALLSISFAVPIPFIVALEPGVVRRDPVAAAADLITAVTRPEERIFVWGNEPYVYLLSERLPAGRFVYLFPLTHPRYATPALIDGLLRDWRRDPPALILDASNHPTAVSAHPLLGPWVWDGDPVADHLDVLRLFVRERYREAEHVDGWITYVPT